MSETPEFQPDPVAQTATPPPTIGPFRPSSGTNWGAVLGGLALLLVLGLGGALAYAWRTFGAPESAQAMDAEHARIEQRLASLEARPVAATPDLAPLDKRIAALEQRPAPVMPKPVDLDPLEGRIGALETRTPPPVDLAPLDARIAAVEGRKGPDLTPLAARVAAVEGRAPPDLKPLDMRLAALEGRAPPDLKPLADRLAALEGKPAPDVRGEVKPLADRLAAIEQTVAGFPSRGDLSGLAGRMDQVAGREDQIAGRQASIDQAVAGRLDALESKIGVAVAAGAALAVEIPRLGQRLDGIDQKVAAVDQRVSGVDGKFSGVDQKLAGVDQRIAGVDQKVTQSFAGVDEKISGVDHKLDQKVAGVDEKLGAETRRVATIEGSVGQLPALADRATRMAKLQAAAQALDQGQPLGPLAGAPPELARFADAAPPTQSGLRLSFPKYSAAAAAASEPVAAGSFWNRVEARAEALVSVRQGDTVLVGDPAGGILSHARRTLDAGDLAGTVTTLGALRGPAAAAMKPWVDDAQALMSARKTLAEMAGHA